MSLTSRASRNFPVEVRNRGVAFFRAVSIESCEGRDVVAKVKVKSDQTCDVTMHWNGHHMMPTVIVSCSCPDFEEGNYCKHVWATFVALDVHKKDFVPGRAPIRVISAFGESAKEESDVNDDDFEETARSLLRRSEKRRVGSHRLLRRREEKEIIPSGWLGKIEHYRGKVREKEEKLLFADETLRKVHDIWYILDIEESKKQDQLIVSFFQRSLSDRGVLGRRKILRLVPQDIELIATEEDKALLTLLIGTQPMRDSSASEDDWQKYSRSQIPPLLYPVVLEKLSQCERFGVLIPSDRAEKIENVDGVEGENTEDVFQRLSWNAQKPWSFEVRFEENGDDYEVSGVLSVLDDAGSKIEKSLTEATLVISSGLVLDQGTLAPIAEASSSQGWIQLFRDVGKLTIPQEQRLNFLQEVYQLPHLSIQVFPESFQLKEKRIVPVPHLQLKSHKNFHLASGVLMEAKIKFDYETHLVRHHMGPACWVNELTQEVVPRDYDFEKKSFRRLDELGFRKPNYEMQRLCDYVLPPRSMNEALSHLMSESWVVELDGKKTRKMGAVSVHVASGIDWFDLTGKVSVGNEQVPFPRLLQAIRQGERMITLKDGSLAMISDEMVERFGGLAQLGEADDKKARFKKSQITFLDALLEAKGLEVESDAAFKAYRQKLKDFNGIALVDQPNGLKGELREYQREGLSWLSFLKNFSFGGCLADDMGLGKTIQVLAHLEAHREKIKKEGGVKKPSLAVVPRSLVYNWMDEAKKFTPDLMIEDYTGSQRSALLKALPDYDLIVTTYGMVRRDIETLSKLDFEYVILDESQAIKNSSSQTSRSVKLLKSSHRLAMTGTPVENHLGELWSLFEFLSPGLFGPTGEFKENLSRKADTNMKALSQGLRPFLLRRTKQQVLKELPEKTEQTIYCELDDNQKQLYEELKSHYRSQLLMGNEGLPGKGDNDVREGAEPWQKNKMHVLEALLRLRQVACHPGLVDANRKSESSAKLEVLLERLREVISEGHKALVFSQFTQMLGIVKDRLDAENIPYEYLDGKTRDRKSRVEHFQEDPDCKLFLISLKAGGFGLNLTAAEYVFILDPWWNPAVEAQAIDRVHRIGQDKPVFAYRLIGKDTVEEKILKLQKEKKDLADAILSEDNRLIKDLTREDLEYLLN